MYCFSNLQILSKQTGLQRKKLGRPPKGNNIENEDTIEDQPHLRRAIFRSLKKVILQMSDEEI